jgi:tetratricopeptide (TPR) repeat protein
MKQQVKVWVEDVIIPTYPIGKPEKNPMFLEKRVYQGSSGVVYPHPVIEKIYDEKVDKTYKGVFLENAYIKIMVLPELGGRIQMAYDKVKQRHFIYYNQVIKPALVGLTGPWISGGIEFNWPQHHRPSTFDPVDYTLEENKDGSMTIWVNEVERMFRTKGMAGFTLYPDKAYIEIKGKLYNRTPFPQTFLWWANPAVKVNDHYQSIFPPDVYAVFDHGKRDVSSFPIAKGVYYKVDYSPGTDISRYKNIPVPTSYMSIASKYNFIGGYEHDTQGGLLHVADHHISPGKKQWTWGYGEFGQAWDRNLTDEDGPYIELMTGIYTDNQPDFSWIQPFEEKTFVQYFMPYREVGVVKNASKEAVAGIEFRDNQVDIKLHVTSPYERIKVALVKGDEELFTEVIKTSPEEPYIKTITLNGSVVPEEIQLVVTNLENQKVLISYQHEKVVEQEIPSPAQAAKRPKDVENNEQLYLTGLHLEQYRHATYSATDYYEEALVRDEKDVRNNNALGLWYLRRARFAKAEPYFRKAIATLTQRNPNPYEGEPYYNLGWCLKLQGRNDEAFDAFYKSVWNDAWQHAGYLNLARIATLRQEHEEALELISKSLIKNYHSHTARHLKTAILRKLGRNDEGLSLIDESLGIDPFNFGCLFEKYLLLKDVNKHDQANEALQHLKQVSRNWVHNFIEYAFDYAHAGLYEESLQLLLEHVKDSKEQYPMVYYYLGWISHQLGDNDQALKYFKQASSLSPDFCFPNRIEDVPVLQKAIELNKDDAKAYYYLGNFWYDKRQYNAAIECWEQSVRIDDNFPTARRNLSLAYYNKLNKPEQALASLEKAFALDTSDARVLMELDQLYKKLNTPLQQRLSFLEKHLPLVNFRDDLYLERVTLYNQLGEYQTARDLIATYKFHPWEGGEGKVVGQYLIAHIELAKDAIEAGESEKALQLLHDAQHYPENLGEGKLYGAQENDIRYLQGLAYEKLGEHEKSTQMYKLATEGISEPVQAIFYNDPQPDKIFYQGLAWMKLNENEKAASIFIKLINFGKKHLNDEISIDYFAVSLPDLLVFDADLNLRNKIHCLYLQGLGKLGLGNKNLEDAQSLFDEVLALDVNHQGAAIHKKMVEQLLLRNKSLQQ